jgi:hypothetical protein
MVCINKKIIAMFFDIYISDILTVVSLLFFMKIEERTNDEIPTNISSTVIIDRSIPQLSTFRIAQKTEKQKLKHIKQAG